MISSSAVSVYLGPDIAFGVPGALREFGGPGFLSASKLTSSTTGPPWAFPRFVLGAIGSFLEPLSSPKVDEIFEK